jgi:hypothetical protein
MPTELSRSTSIRPLGPFSWDAACDVLANFAPMWQHWRGTARLVPLSFLLDGDFTPVAAATWWADGELQVELSGTDQVDAAAAQVARIYSLDHDATDYPEVGRRDPKVGRLMEALPGLRPICFTSPYETAAWGVISQRISMRQAAAIKARLIEEHGHRLRVAGVEVAAFPAPERPACSRLAGTEPSSCAARSPASGPSGPPGSTSAAAASLTSSLTNRSRSPPSAICTGSATNLQPAP